MRKDFTSVSILLVFCGLSERILMNCSGEVNDRVRVGEFKFISLVMLHRKLKCLSVLVSNHQVLTPCDCVGYFEGDYLFKYYFPYHMRVEAGTVIRPQEDKDEERESQARTPYIMRKHPQCCPYSSGSYRWLMYNYGLITVSFPFIPNHRVGSIAVVGSLTVKTIITDLINTKGECKSVSFPNLDSEPEYSTYLEFSHFQLKPMTDCRRELCPSNETCSYNDLFFFGKFCATERFFKSRDACFNDSGAPVICGGRFIGHFGDVYPCTGSSRGRVYTYARFDWAVPFISYSGGTKHQQILTMTFTFCIPPALFLGRYVYH